MGTKWTCSMWKNRILPAQRMPPHAACRRSMPELGSMSWLNGNSMLEILVFHILGLMLLDPPQEIVANGGVVEIHQNHRKLDNWGSSFHWLDGACTFVGIASSTKIIQIHQISKTKQWTVQKLMYYLFPWDITAALSATSGHCWLTPEVQPPGPISAICHP